MPERILTGADPTRRLRRMGGGPRPRALRRALSGPALESGPARRGLRAGPSGAKRLDLLGGGSARLGRGRRGSRGRSAVEPRPGRAVPRQLGATAPVGNNSNECLLDGERVVIKCAKPATSSVGVTFHMLKKLDAVVGAFQRDDGAFAIWSLTAALFKDHMRDTRSRSSAGRVGIVSRDVFEAKGKALGRVRL